MSDLSSSGPGKTGPSKKRISPARNLIGLVVLLAVVAVAWFEYSAVIRYRAAVKALDARTQDEEKELLTVQEAESLLGKSPDGPGGDVTDGNQGFTKKTYTWSGLLKSHTLTAFYTKGVDPRLHHLEPEGAKYAAEPKTGAPTPTTTTAAGPTSEPTSVGSKAGTSTAPVPASEPAAKESKPRSDTAPVPASEPAAKELKPTTTTAPVPEKSPK